MSKTNLKQYDKTLLYLRTGGRCEICRSELDFDCFSRSNVSIREYAHIIGDSPDGPRGKVNSKKYSGDINNIIVLCPSCHTRVDKNLDYYTVERLHEYKLNHEDKVVKLYKSLSNDLAIAIKYSAPIGNHLINIADDLVDTAIRDTGFLVSEMPIELNPNYSALNDSDASFWDFECKQLHVNFERKIRPFLESGDENRFLLFALAPQPLLIHLGTMLNDLHRVHVFTKRREPDTWSWGEGKPIEYSITNKDIHKGKVALKISLSARITDKAIYKVLGTETAIWEITQKNPKLDFLRTEEQLKKLRESYRDLFSQLNSAYDGSYKIHVFPACPNSAAIEFGRVWMPKANLLMELYDKKQGRGFEYAFPIPYKNDQR